MRIGYQPVDTNAVRFRVTFEEPSARRRRPPARQVHGLATLDRETLTISELMIVEAAGVTTATLREIPLGEIREHILIDLRNHPELLEPPERSPDEHEALIAALDEWRTFRGDLAAKVAEQLEASKKTLEETLRRLQSETRSRPGDDFYREVAEAYIRLSHIRSRDPAAALLQEMRAAPGRKNLSRNTVSAWIRRARERGWLAPATQGRAGAEPGDRLLEYWQQEEE